MTDYTLRFSEPSAHLVDVAMRFPVPDPERPVTVWMPVWTPGSYLVREYSRHVESFEATAPDGATLPWKKTRKNRWEIDPQGCKELSVGYRVYGRELSVRTNWIEDGFALLNGAATFLFVEGLERRPHRVRLEIPGAWEGVWTALDASGDDGRSFVAADMDHLVDSPIAAGCPSVHPFDVNGVPISLVNFEDGSLWDGARAVLDLKAIVEAYRDMYGGLPFDRYVFLNFIVEGSGGLEHKNSCVLMTSRYVFRKRKSYIDWVGLVSHEFFHVWNVKRSRPEALGPFDYQNEVYTRSLWVAEGITNYYTDLVPCRAGVTTVPEFLEELWDRIVALQGAPGRRFQSLEEASFDTWIKLYRPDENSVNSSMSYYVKGAVVAWLLDAAIRAASGNERSLDDVMRLLFERFSGERGFSEQDVESAAEETAGKPLGAFFDRALRSREELDYAPALAHWGLRWKEEPQDPKPWLGVTTSANDGRIIVTSVRRDGPSRESGLNVEDEILALGGYRVNPENLEERLKQYGPGDRIEVLVARRGAIRSLPVTLWEEPRKPGRLEINPEAPPEAVLARNAWLGKS